MKYLKKFNESKDSLVVEIEKDKFSDNQKILMGEDAIRILKDQINKIENDIFGEKFEESRARYFDKKFYYHRKLPAIYSVVSIRQDRHHFLNDGPSTDLYVEAFEVDDSWYIVHIYSMWYHHYFQCDDIIGLQEFAKVAIETVNNDQL